MEQLFGVLLSLYKGTPGHGEWVVTCLQGAWAKIVGDRLASVCRPAMFSGSELVVEIVNPGWEEAVNSVRPVLVEKLNMAAPGLVKTLSLRKIPSPHLE